MSRLGKYRGKSRENNDEVSLLRANIVLRIVAFLIDISIIRFSFQGLIILLGSQGIIAETLVNSTNRILMQGLAPFRGWIPFFNVLHSLEDLQIHIMISIYLLLYFILLEHYWGRTIGKKITKMRVVDKKGEKITLKNSFLRNITKYIWRLPLIGLLLGLTEWIILFFYDDRIGDILGDTIVVSKVQGNIFSKEE